MDLTKEMEQYARQHGADLFGIADLAPARTFLESRSDPLVIQFPMALSMGMRLSEPIVDSHNPEESSRTSLYWHHVYNVVTPALDRLAYDLARYLNQSGFSAFPVPGSTPYDFKKLEGMISHKLAAHLSGLGWIGKSCLLVTEPYGPRVRFVTVLTNASLTPGVALNKPCGQCHVCVDACPVRAFTGVEFQELDPREVRFEAKKCSEYRRDHACGLCVSACPQGRKGIRKKKGNEADSKAGGGIRPL